MATKKEIRLYGDLVHQHKISFKTIIFELLIGLLNKRHGVKDSVYEDGETFSPSVDHLRELPLKYLAVVNNKNVLEMIRLDENTAKYIQKRGSKLIEFDPTTTLVKKGMMYMDEKFINKEETSEKNEED